MKLTRKAKRLQRSLKSGSAAASIARSLTEMEVKIIRKSTTVSDPWRKPSPRELAAAQNLLHHLTNP